MSLRDPGADVFGYGPLLDLFDPLTFIYQRGGRIFDDLENPTRTTFDDPLTIDALDWYSRLFFDYCKRLPVHLEQVDRLVKKYLFADSDQRNVNLARKLVADSRLLRSNYDKYLKHWTESGGQRFHIADHEAFLCETRELFELVLERIQRETEYLYPLLRKVEGGERQAA